MKPRGTRASTTLALSLVLCALGSDLLGEACHTNSGVVPVVPVTLGSTVTDYLDDHRGGVHLTGGTQYMLALNPPGTQGTYVGSEPSGPYAFFVDYQ